MTLRFQSTGTVPGNGRPVTMMGSSLTIGRGPENDLVLPDPDRMLSKRHCVIEDHGGNVVVIDFSTNGTFLNYGKVPLGQVTTPLNDGDVLSLGSYELVVSIATGQSRDLMADLPPPVGEVAVSHGRAGAAPDLSNLLDDPIQGGDFLDDLMGGARPAGPGSVKREDPFDPLSLAPLPDDDDFLGKPAPVDYTGASRSNHSPSGQDAFRPAGAARSASVIPDDWDDLLAPTPAPRAAPRAPAPPPPRAPAPLPDDDFLSDLAPAAPPAPSRAPAPPTARALPPDDDFLSDLAPSAPTGGIPEDVFLAPPAPPRAAPPPPVQPVAPAAVAPVAPPPVAPAPPAPTPVAAEPASPASTDATRAFLTALGVGSLPLTDAELPDTMSRLGGVLRAMIEGVREILMTRSHIKGEFRINQTMISAGRNNPLKFSVTPEQAVEALVKPPPRGYLDAPTATAEALKDIKAHEVAMVTGMEAALKGVLAKLDPKALEGRIADKGGFAGLLKNRKAQYWETYEALYAEISDQAENDFNELFAKEFSRAYQEQLERLK